MIIVKEGLTGKNPAEKVKFGGNVIEKTTDNAFFPDAAPFVAIVNTATVGLKKANDTGIVSTINARVVDFNNSIKGLVLHIQSVILGKTDIIAIEMVDSTGFGTGKKGKPIIADLAAVNGEEANTVVLRKKVTTGRKHVAYIAQLCTGDPTVEANWSYCKFSTVATVTISGLASNVRYYFRVAVVIGEVMSEYSDITSVMVN
jgi:hypothetical protein